MLQNKNRTGKLKVVATSAFLVGAMLFIQCAKESAPVKSVSTVVPERDANGVYTIADKMPEFNGDLMQYLGGNIKYPKEAQDKKIEGRVVIKFVVDEQGKVTNAQVVRSVDPLLDNAALLVVNNMPTWRPGEKAGKTVKVYYTIPISFKLGKDNTSDKG